MHGSVVHVHAHGHFAGHVVGQSVGLTHRLRVGDQSQLDVVRGDPIGQAVPQSFGCLALRRWAGRLRDRLTIGLRDFPDVRGLEPDQLEADGLAEAGLLPGSQRRHESGSAVFDDA
jgi:hypothetical protein